MRANRKALAAEHRDRILASRKKASDRRLVGKKYSYELCGLGPDGTEKNAPRIPLNWSWKEAFVPAVLDHDPVSTFRDTDSNSPVKRQRSRVFEMMSEYHWTQQKIRSRVIEPALEDAIPNGLSAAVVEYDPIEDLSRAVFVHSDDVDIDLDADHPDIRFVRWVSTRRRVPIASAKRVWPGYEFAPNDGMDTENIPDVYKVGSSPTDPSAHEAKDTLVWSIFIKANDPYTDDVADSENPKKNKQIDGAIYKNTTGRPIVRYLAYARAKNASPEESEAGYSMCIVGEEDWSVRHMPCRADEFPVCFLRMTVDTKSFWPRSMFDPVRGASDQANSMSIYEDDDASQAVARWILYDGGQIDEDTVRKMVQTKGLGFFKVNGRMALESVKLVEGAGNNNTAAINGDRSVGRYESVVRLNDLRPQARSHESAAGSQLRADVVSARIKKPGELVAEFSADITKRLIACDRLHCVSSRIARIIGVEELQYETVDETEDVTDEETGEVIQKPVIDERDGSPKTMSYSLVWDEEAGWDDILGEIDIIVDPNATVRPDKEAELSNIASLKAAIQSDIQLVMQAGGATVNPERLAKMTFGITAMIAEIVGARDFARLIPKPEELFSFAPPQMPSGSGGVNLEGDLQAAQGGMAANASQA